MSGAEQAVGEQRRRRPARRATAAHHPIDGVRRAAVEAVHQRAEVLLAIVIGRRKSRPAGWRPRRSMRPQSVARSRRATGRSVGLGGAASRPGCSAVCRPPLARQFVGGLRNLRFEIFHRSGDVEIVAGDSVRSKSSASSSSLATSLSRFLVVVGFFAMPPLPCTSAREGHDLAHSCPRTRLIMDPPVS